MKINTVPNTLQQGRAHDFYWGQDRRPRAGMGFLGGAVIPLPTSYGVLRERCEPPAGFGTEPRPPKGFPLFSALMIASPDTIILLLLWTIMQPLGARPPCPLSLRRPCFTIAFAQCSQTVCEIWLYHNAYSGRAAARGSVCS